MRLKRLSQIAPVQQPVPLASNPSTAQAMGLNNMPLGTGFTGGMPMGGASNAPSGVSATKLMSLIAKSISDPNLAANKQTHISEFQQLIPQIQDPSVKDQVQGLVQALNFNSDPSKPSTNPSTGQPMPSPAQIALPLLSLLADKLEAQLSSQQPAQAPASPMGGAQMGGSPMGAPRTAQVIKKKKKTRGNPFKVLMGKVGKLLDHGLTKNQITRYLSKQKYWSADTIEKAIDIVKDYNKKKHREAVNKMRVLIAAEKEEINEYEVNYSAASTADLMLRKEFLEDCTNVDLGFKPKNPKKQLGVIKRILRERGLKV